MATRSLLVIAACAGSACGGAENPGQLDPPSGVCPPIAQLAKAEAHFEKGPSDEIEIVFRVDPLPRSDVFYRDDPPYLDAGFLAKKSAMDGALVMRIRFDPRKTNAIDVVVPTKCRAGTDGLALRLIWSDVEVGASIDVSPITIGIPIGS